MEANESDSSKKRTVRHGSSGSGTQQSRRSCGRGRGSGSYRNRSRSPDPGRWSTRRGHGRERGRECGRGRGGLLPEVSSEQRVSDHEE